MRAILYEHGSAFPAYTFEIEGEPPDAYEMPQLPEFTAPWTRETEPIQWLSVVTKTFRLARVEGDRAIYHGA